MSKPTSKTLQAEAERLAAVAEAARLEREAADADKRNADLRAETADKAYWTARRAAEEAERAWKRSLPLTPAAVRVLKSAQEKSVAKSETAEVLCGLGFLATAPRRNLGLRAPTRYVITALGRAKLAEPRGKS
jgi:hypothetical protein